MNVIEITPPKQLNFSLPSDMQRVLTLTNLTLHSVYVLILNSHPFELSLSEQMFTLQAFEEKKVTVTLNWLQEASNLSTGKLRIYYQELEQEVQSEYILQQVYSQQSSSSYAELQVEVSPEGKQLQYLQGWEGQQGQKKIYQLKRVSHLQKSTKMQNNINSSDYLRNQVLSYLQHLPEVVSIEPCDQDGSFLVEFAADKKESCELVQFPFEQEFVVYAFKRIVAYGMSRQMPPLLSLEDENHKNNNQSAPEKQPIQKKNKELKEQQLEKNLSQQRKESPKRQEKNQNQKKKEEKAGLKGQEKIQKKRQAVKQSFIARREGPNKTKRRNKSEEKIVEASSDEQDGTFFIEQLKALKKQQLSRQQIKVKPVFKESTFELTQKVLAMWVEQRHNSTEVYVVVRDCVRCFVLEQPLARKSIKFDAIYQQNIGLPCPIDRYKDELIFGNESTLYWVNIVSGQAEWKYVQRKDIYCLSVIEQLSLVAVGGRSFSKLSYFGKSTARSNLKLYSCSSADKHDHLFTYDIPGENVGNVHSMAYASVPPHGIKLLIVHTMSQGGNSTLHFLRVKAFNKVEVFGQVDLDELGILNLLKFKYNRQTARLVCLQTLGEAPRVDCFKRLKLRCQYEKVEVATEGIKVPLRQYISFHLVGGQDNGGEWMALVDREGSLCHVYNFDGQGEGEDMELGKGEVRQLFWLRGGRYVLVCSDYAILVRERIE